MSKKFLFMLSLILIICPARMAECDVNIATTFQDPAFRKIIEGYDRYKYNEEKGYWESGYSDGYLSDYELEKITEINASSPYSYKEDKLNEDYTIKDFSGIKSLKYLKKITIVNHPIEKLDISGMTNLQWVSCSGHGSQNIAYLFPLRKVNASGCTSLTYMSVSETAELNVKGCSLLDELYVSGNHGYLDEKGYFHSNANLGKINLDGCDSLRKLSINYTTLESLSLKNYKSLETFSINNNVEMISLDLSGCTSLVSAHTNYTPSKYADWYRTFSPYDSPNLRYLNLSGCTSLPEVYARSMTELNLSGCTSLKKFWFKIFMRAAKILQYSIFH